MGFQAEPDWRLEDMFVYEVHQVSLNKDTSSTHAITASVGKPHQMNATDSATYMKAAAVLRMLRYTLTDAVFKRAIKHYLSDNA